MNFKNKGALWLWDSNECYNNQYVCFRQNICIDNPEKAYIYLCCDTTYELTVNGKFVNFGQYLAQPENKFFDKLDISEYLTCGNNAVCVLVYYQGIGSSCYATGTPGLIYYIECDGKTYVNNDVYVSHASGYKEGDLPRISPQLGPSFEFDARKAQDWKNPGFVPGADWRKATVLEFDRYLTEEIKPRPIKKLDFSERADFKIVNRGVFEYVDDETVPVAKRMHNALIRAHSPNGVKKNTEFTVDTDKTCIILDIGSETSGYFELDIDAECEMQIDVSYGEHLTDLRVRSSIGHRNFAFTYYCKKGRNVYSNFTRRLAGRYIQLHFSGVQGNNTVHFAGLRKAEYPVKRKKDLCITDKLHKKIYETCIRTLKECMHEHYEDCPWREQSLYGFDSRNQILAGYTVFENHAFVKSCLYLMDSAIGEDGYLNLCVPKSDILKIPGFSLMWITAVCEYVENTGRTNDMKPLFARIEKMFDTYFENITEQNILLLPAGKQYWFFYDWADGLSGTIKAYTEKMPEEQDTDSVYNLMMCYALKKYTDMCDTLGINSAKYKKYHRTLKKGINDLFYNSKKALYRTFTDKEHYCQISQALAVLSGVAVNSRMLRRALVSDDSLVKATLSTMALKYEALIQDEAYLDTVMDEIAETWGNMLFDGATTFYETEKGEEDFSNAGSLCHGWSAIPLVVYKKYYGHK